MKTFYTSHYSLNGRHPKAVSISARAPHFFKGRWYLDLAPSWGLITAYKFQKLSEHDYTDAYLDLIINERKLNPHKVVNDLEDGSMLLCYEPDDGSFCHRHIVAEWLQRETGIIIEEWKPPKLLTIADELLVF
jgi:uncharacterized protein YeaO (DUF488 family)